MRLEAIGAKREAALKQCQLLREGDLPDTADRTIPNTQRSRAGRATGAPAAATKQEHMRPRVLPPFQRLCAPSTHNHFKQESSLYVLGAEPSPPWNPLRASECTRGTWPDFEHL